MSLRLPLLAAMVALLSLGSSLGCAVASDELDPTDGGKKKDTGYVLDDTGDEDTGGGDEDSSSNADSASTDTGSSSTDSGDDGSSSDTGSATDTSGTPCTSLSSSDCSSGATDLGSVSGDKNADVKTATGTDNQFLRVKVTEDDSSILSSKDLHVRVTLSSTDPANFDLYVYLGSTKADGGSIECTSVKDSSTVSGSDDVIEETWTDNHPIGGSDDTRYVTIEVRSATPTCSGASWSLTVEGNK
jgi:hypothetical protein